MVELLIERPVAGGRMLARHDGRVVLVSGAIPGERVRARIERSTRSVVFAETVDVLEASEFRRDVIGDPTCGGLLLSHVQYEHQLRLKADVLVDTFRRIGKLTLPAPPSITSSPEEGYRLRARLHVRNGQVGFFREGTRALCDAGPSRQLSSGALAAVEAVVSALGEAAVGLDAVTIAENVSASKRVLLLEPSERSAVRVPENFALVAGVHGLSVLRGNTIKVLSGDASVRDSAADFGLSQLPPAVGWTRSVASFFQGNRFVLRHLLESVLARAQGTRVLDLYAGVGLFAIPLAARGAHVVAVEGDVASGDDLQSNAAVWPRLDPRLGSVEDVLNDAGVTSDVDCVIVDPPRTGLSPVALERILALRVPRVVYVSCDPATLARDAAGLVGSGYELRSVEGFDMFPNTPHIEALAVFDRVTA